VVHNVNSACGVTFLLVQLFIRWRWISLRYSEPSVVGVMKY